jgi:hypothetical protein
MTALLSPVIQYGLQFLALMALLLLPEYQKLLLITLIELHQ